MLSLVRRSPIRRTLLISAIRHNSSVPAKTRRFGSIVLVGVTGVVGVVFGAGAAGYAWYHFSGARKVVARVQEAIVYLDKARDNLAKRKPPSEVLWFLRRAVKTYVAFPGSNFVVDQVFDAVDDKVDAHGDEANALIATAYTQIRDLIQQDGKEHAGQVLKILRNLMKELQPKSLELKEQMAERYEVGKKRATDGLATSAAAAKTKIQDSKLFQQKIENPFRRKPDNNDVSLDPASAPDAAPLKSDDDSS